MEVNPQPTEPLLMKPISDSLPKDNNAFSQVLNHLTKPSRICSECGRDFHDLELSTNTVCWDCHKKAAAKQRFESGRDRLLGGLDEWGDAELLAAGAASRELRASMELIPKGVKKRLPVDLVRRYLDGEHPSSGWGIGGNTGCGKTMAMAAMFRTHIQSIAKREAPRLGYFRLEPGRRVWSSWPDEVSWLRANALDPAVHERIEVLQECELLLLDDLGRERIKGSYSEDWAASQLDGILNARYRYERPIIWTTNLTLQQLADIYGGAMLSRLTADNPLIWVDNLVDLRG